MKIYKPLTIETNLLIQLSFLSNHTRNFPKTYLCPTFLDGNFSWLTDLTLKKTYTYLTTWREKLMTSSYLRSQPLWNQHWVITSRLVWQAKKEIETRAEIIRQENN